MMDKVKVCKLEELELGGSQAFETPIGKVVVFRTRKNQLFATDTRCPHMGGPINHAIYDGNRSLTCPLHGYTFNVESGACSDETLGRSLKVFQVHLEAGEVYVQKNAKAAVIVST